nr:MAG TPA: hypothetical protein [Caudoviricetes sp.]
MSNSVNFYTIAFEKNNIPTNYSIDDFFQKIESLLNRNEEYIIKRIKDEIIRCFNFRYDEDRTKIIIPLGKVKNKNKPHWLNEDRRLEEIPEEIYDVNSLAYDKNEKIMFFTTNIAGPKISLIEDYFNSFIPTNLEMKIKIKPIIINKGLQTIRNANYVRTVNLNLDLGVSLNNFYIAELENNRERSLLETLRNLSVTAKDITGSRNLNLTLGVGHSGREGSLDLESILALLNQINLEGEFVKEISVAYKNGLEEKIDKTKLKNATSILAYPFPIASSTLSSEYLFANFNEAIRGRRAAYSSNLRDYFRNCLYMEIEDYTLIEESEVIPTE